MLRKSRERWVTTKNGAEKSDGSERTIVCSGAMHPKDPPITTMAFAGKVSPSIVDSYNSILVQD